MDELTRDMTIVQAIRFAITTEYDAVNVYETVAKMTSDEKIKQLMLDIAKEEKVHIGELETILKYVDNDSLSTTLEGKQEVDTLLNKIAKRIVSIDKRFQNNDGSFKEMTSPDNKNDKKNSFNGCIRYMMSQGKSKESAEKICGYIAQQKKK